MNISKAIERPLLAAEPSTFSAAGLCIPDDQLHKIRMKIYHSTGDGYFIFRSFLTPGAVTHIRELWTSVEPQLTHQEFIGKHQFQVGCPNFFSVQPDGSKIFFNFFWNTPLDEVTQEVSVCVHMLRNRISGRNAFAEMFPGGPKAVSYRVTISRNPKTWIAPHRDYADFKRRLEKGQFDPSRLQATLFLSEKGVDYSGIGFRLERNDGSIVAFGTDLSVAAGDLVIWKYSNLHSVEEVQSSSEQLGFMRILYPPEDILPAQTVDNLPAQTVDNITLRSLVRFGKSLVRRAPGALVRRGKTLARRLLRRP